MGNHSQTSALTSQGFELSREARAQADLKFTYVVSCQIYGQQKQRKAPEATDIGLLLRRFDLIFLFLLMHHFIDGILSVGFSCSYIILQNIFI